MDILERLDPFTATPQDISDAYNEIERLREALQKIYWATKEPEIDRIAGAALQQTHDSHAKMSDDKGQIKV